jgi:site-specific recombinase XerD
MPARKLLDQVRTVLRVKHFSLSTEKSYLAWIRRFILFHDKRHREYMGEGEIRQFISHLAVDAKISASTQTVALSALLFLYREVLKKELPYVANIERAKRSKHLPVPGGVNRSGGCHSWDQNSAECGVLVLSAEY